MIPVGSADVILGFEPAEAVRVLPYLKQGGAVVVSSRAVKPVTDSLAGGAYTGEEMLAYLHAHVQNLVVIDGEAVCQACGSSRVLNVALLGAAAGKGVLPFSSQEMEKALEQRLPARFLEMKPEGLFPGGNRQQGSGNGERYSGGPGIGGLDGKVPPLDKISCQCYHGCSLIVR